MNTDLDFYKWFETIAVKLGYREISFRKIFEYLDNQPTPIVIVETGALREEGNFLSDGQSTLLFDKYTQFRGDNSKVYTVDINPNVTNLCKQIVSDKVDIITGDSVGYLNSFSKNFIKSNKQLSMLYLDSYDVDFRYPFPSAAHHLKELTSSIRMLQKNSLVVIDDAPANIPSNSSILKTNKIFRCKCKIKNISKSTVGGKGLLINEYAVQIGAKLLFSHYQTGWNEFNN